MKTTLIALALIMTSVYTQKCKTDEELKTALHAYFGRDVDLESEIDADQGSNPDYMEIRDSSVVIIRFDSSPEFF